MSVTTHIYQEKPWLKHYGEIPPTVSLDERSIGEVFDEVTQQFAQHTALIFYGRKLSFAEVKNEVDRLATALSRLGVGKGDRVALFLLNSPQFVISYFAVLKLGAVLTAISPVYSSSEVRHQLTDSGAEIVICHDVLYETLAKANVPLKHVIVASVSEYLPSFKKWLGKSFLKRFLKDAHVPQIDVPRGEHILKFKTLIDQTEPDPPQVEINIYQDLAALGYTGGTTGAPKGAMLTQANLRYSEFQLRTFLPNLEQGQEVVPAFLPFYHIYGQIVNLFGGLLQGFTLILFTTPDLEEILEAVETYQATMFNGVPTMFEILKEHPKTDRVNWQRMKLVTCGADTLQDSTVEDWKRKTGTEIIQGYGLTETAAPTHFNPVHRPKLGSFGIPLPNVEAAVIDPDQLVLMPVGEVGELILRGPNVFKGYWQKEEQNQHTFVELDGKTWFRTGDLVRMDEEGYFFFYDRKKDLIKYKGYSVFARDIEDVLYRHPQIKAAGVIGVPDPRAGQLIKAIVVLQTEARGKVKEEDIIDYCREHLAPYKVPKIVEFRGELPKTDVGKVSRRELREEMEEI
ncbi:AMP-dependent synthetase and ligase [Caldalkalibacillus thermarum TA2.A1]|uniref:AMP-binding protein n=1 Tax=Caldalkalibacillus thermarum (strain TA2.A1) TaxID=986075 RepID=F5L6S6_CALTT|nr:AMP-binding protein [Caldalkalibacillus thermarum]EGL82969.1 AMP-dependent synthetase and ligase [Caldalkalibacillus thermarum TA2.A1]QZT33592.1 AMP-binding protein [Caldalkalibacillus thermarum TA2.A1]